MNLTSNLQTSRKQQWGAVIIVSMLTAVFLSVPYFLAHKFTNSGLVYTHLIMNPEDSNTYWAKMFQGYDGEWLYTIPFTPEAHDGAMVGVFYVWLGQLARWLGMSLTAVWHTSRIIASTILFLTIYGFISAFTQTRRSRWTAYLLTLFGSGLGWLLFIFGTTYWLNAFPVDFKQPGAHIFFTAMTYPHISIGTACILISMWTLKKLTINHQPLTINHSLFIITLANFSNLLLGISYPFLLYLVIGTAVLYWLILTIQSRTILWQQAILFAATCIIPAPLYIYFAYVLRTNSVFAAWDAQAVTPSAPWPHYLIAYGPYLLLAGILWWKRPSSRKQYAILWCWLLVVILLLYAPLNPQRRFLQGVQVPLSILATIGLIDIIIPRLTQARIWQNMTASPRYETPKMIRLLLLLFLLGMSLSNIYLWMDVTRTAVFVQPDPLFRPQAEIEAALWLRENVSKTAVILGDLQTGNYVAAHAGQRVVLGHWAETVDYEVKTFEVARFYDARTGDTWRREYLDKYMIDYVWHGPREILLGEYDLHGANYLDPTYSADGITIYKVQR